MKKLAIGALLFVVILLTAAKATEEDFISEASGVCRLGTALVVAGDETPDSLWLVDGPSASPKLVSVINGEWDDMEDLSAVNESQFFAMTSHSLTKKGKQKAEREQLILMSRKKSFFEIEDSWTLREALLAKLEESVGDDLELDSVQYASPDEGGLNVEGLAYQNGELYLGLRSPLTNQKEALVLKISNANDLLKGGFPEISQVMRLRLGNRGVRSLSTYGKKLIVIAGSSNDADKDFALYQWEPKTSKPTLFAVPGFKTLLRPEGVVAQEDGSLLFVQDFEEPSEQDVLVRLKP